MNTWISATEDAYLTWAKAAEDGAVRFWIVRRKTVDSPYLNIGWLGRFEGDAGSLLNWEVAT